MYAVILVPSTSHALRAEKVLRASGVECKLIPVPRHLSSDCGVCVRIPQGAAEAARDVLEKTGLEYSGIYAV